MRPLAVTAAILALATTLGAQELPDGAVARLGSTNLSHTSGVRGLIWSRDGARLFSLGNDAAFPARAWDATTGKLALAVPDLGGAPAGTAFALTPDGATLAIALTESKKAVVLASATTGKEVARLEVDALVLALAFSPDGKRLAGGLFDGRVRVWDVATGKPRDLEGPVAKVGVTTVAWPAAAQLVAATANDIAVLDPETGKKGLTLAKRALLAVSPDGKRWASQERAAGATPDVLDAATGKRVAKLAALPSYVQSATFSADGALVALGDGAGGVTVSRAATGDVLLRLEGAGPRTQGLAFSPDGNRLAIGRGDHALSVVELPSGKVVLEPTGHPGGATTVRFAPAGGLLATGGADGSVRLWDVAKRTELRRIAGGSPVDAVAWSRDGKTLAIARHDGSIGLHDAATGRSLRAIAEKGKANGRALAFSPDGSLLAGANADGAYVVWDVATGAVKVTLDSKVGAEAAVAFLPDGRLLVADEAGPVVAHELPSGKRRQKIAEAALLGFTAALAAAPDGGTIAVGASGRGFLLFDVAHGTSREIVETVEDEARGGVRRGRALAFLSGGKVLASSRCLEGSGKIALVDVAAGAVTKVLDARSEGAIDLAASPDGALLAVACGDGTVLLYEPR